MNKQNMMKKKLSLQCYFEALVSQDANHLKLGEKIRHWCILDTCIELNFDTWTGFLLPHTELHQILLDMTTMGGGCTLL